MKAIMRKLGVRPEIKAPEYFDVTVLQNGTPITIPKVQIMSIVFHKETRPTPPQTDKDAP